MLHQCDGYYNHNLTHYTHRCCFHRTNIKSQSPLPSHTKKPTLSSSNSCRLPSQTSWKSSTTVTRTQSRRSRITTSTRRSTSVRGHLPSREPKPSGSSVAHMRVLRRPLSLMRWPTSSEAPSSSPLRSSTCSGLPSSLISQVSSTRNEAGVGFTSTFTKMFRWKIV